MKSVRLVQLGHSLQNIEVPVPEIGPADVLVRVAACGICHSDAHYRAVEAVGRKGDASGGRPRFACITWRTAAPVPSAYAATSNSAPRCR